MQIPRATYRLQFNEHFRLADALALVPYFHALGISHLYASPLFKATPHSGHGYDVCDYNQLNREIGTEADLEKLVEALREKKMGLVLDIVPNHMGVTSSENSWWWDVLKNGRASKFYSHFDIDWESTDPKLRGKILLPILGGEYGNILQKNELRVEKQNDEFVLRYFENRFPIAPGTIAENISLEKLNSDPNELDRLIQRQNYFLEFHERGDARLNYRRFFSISSLAAIRVEDENVFNDAHSLLRCWLDQGWLDGLRVDHPDGLRDPQKYLERLRAIAPEAWIVVEKILEPEEPLPDSWPIAGTTGYDFLNQLNGVFVDTGAEKIFTDLYAQFTGEPVDYVALVREKKRAVLKTLFATELTRLADSLAVIASRRAASKNFSRGELHAALAEIIANFPVYRSYISETDGLASAADIAAIKTATHLACEECKDLSPSIFAFIHALLVKPQRGKPVRDFIARFQQLTGPVMAKGVEDTAFYCFNRFTSLNEVGGDPKLFGVSLEAFHKFLQTQQVHWPQSQLATSTHDTKRAEDVRARLNLLSEIPEMWTQTVRRWSAMNACHRQNDFPDRNAEYLFYQALAGAWPLTVERAQAYMEKAASESKQHTTWTKRNLPYEKALQNFISETLHDPEFTADLERFTGTLANAAAVNSLAQTLVKLTAPGVPDIYQGCELWDFSLVDPDNRRPVDFKTRQHLLKEIKSLPIEKIWEWRAEGLPKLWLIQKTLKLRGQFSDFSKFDYQPIFARGAKAEHVIAFSRGGKMITIVPRFLLKLKNDWQNTALTLPAGIWRNEFTGENHHGEIRAENLFKNFSVALLTRKEND
jgi:(1->4)-alpha-D-glucan 1-alpha-D-glucosylmutase